MNEHENSDLGALRQQVGELIGTMREVTHSVKETSQKVDSLGHVITQQAENLRRTELLEDCHIATSGRLDMLERYGHRRDGAVSAASMVAKYGPWSALAAILMAFIAWANGRFL